MSFVKFDYGYNMKFNVVIGKKALFHHSLILVVMEYPMYLISSPTKILIICIKSKIIGIRLSIIWVITIYLKKDYKEENGLPHLMQAIVRPCVVPWRSG